jgi:hypothetical protein
MGDTVQLLPAVYREARCTCGKASEAMKKCAESGMYHTEEKQEDYSALGAVFTMYALTMLNNENHQTQD